MESYMLQNMSLSQSELYNKGLKAQNEAYGTFDIPFLKEFIKKNCHTKSVLDIGTGEGSFIIEIAKEFPEISFIGLDTNEKLLKIAEEHAAQVGLKNIEFKNVFFDDNYEQTKFDLIITRFTIEHSSEPKEFIKQVYKRLNSKGNFVVIDEYWFETLQDDEVWNKFRQQMLATYKSWNCNPYIPKDLTTWLTQTGFENITFELAMNSPSTIGYDKFRNFILTIPVLIHRALAGVWDEEFFPVLEKWAHEICETKRFDPLIAIAHVTGQKN